MSSGILAPSTPQIQTPAGHSKLLPLETSLRYDTIEEFNVESKAECGQFNLAHEANSKQTPVPS